MTASLRRPSPERFDVWTDIGRMCGDLVQTCRSVPGSDARLLVRILTAQGYQVDLRRSAGN